MESERKGFVNFSNHSLKSWSESQINAALSLANGGEIIDIPFTQVSPFLNEKELEVLADEAVEKIMAKNPYTVMCMGETGLCYLVVTKLKALGVKVVYTCSERVAEEKVTDSGTVKESFFRFLRFREF